MGLSVSEKQQFHFERGFKTWSENIAMSFRIHIGLSKIAPLPPRKLAIHIGVLIWELSDVPGLPKDTLSYLSSLQADDWSAVSVHAGSQDVIVMNTTHSAARQTSDLMHELSHIIRKHEPSRIILSEQSGIGIRTFSQLQEAEANWLAGCLLLPRVALVNCMNHNLSHTDIIEKYEVSNALLNYRLNVSGVRKQYAVKGNI